MITVEQLLQRWSGIKDSELTSIILPSEHQEKPELQEDILIPDSTDLFVARHRQIIHSDKEYDLDYAVKKLNIEIYVIDKILENNLGELIYHCRTGNITTLESILHGRNYGYNVGFMLSEIVEYEKNNPYVLYKIIDMNDGIDLEEEPRKAADYDKVASQLASVSIGMQK
jgi:hypothetical protein